MTQKNFTFRTQGLLIVLNCFLSTACSTAAVESTTKTPPQNISEPFPWKKNAVQIKLAKKSGGVIKEACTGFAVSKKLILTAAHCFEKLGKDEIIPSEVAFFANFTNAPLLKKVEAFKVHEGVQENASFNDIAWVKIDSLPDGFTTYPIIENPEALAEKTPLRYFGLAKGDAQSYESLLKKPEPAALKRDSMQRKSFEEHLITAQANYARPGDSGGPLYVEQDGQWAITGLIQEKSFLGTEQLTDKFTALGPQISWIERTSGEKVAHRPAIVGSTVLEKGLKRAPRKVDLRPMTEEEFKAYLPHAIETYTEDLEKSGTYSKKAARIKAINDFKENLPRGIHTRGHYLTRILDLESGEKIGILYYIKDNPKIAYVYDFEIIESKRGGGYGKATMLKLEEKLKAEGIAKVALHVFNHSEVAVGLYQKLGYIKIRDSNMGGMFMEKRLSME